MWSTHDPELESESHRLGATSRAELHEDAFEMPVHRPLPDAKRPAISFEVCPSATCVRTSISRRESDGLTVFSCADTGRTNGLGFCRFRAVSASYGHPLR